MSVVKSRYERMYLTFRVNWLLYFGSRGVFWDELDSSHLGFWPSRTTAMWLFQALRELGKPLVILANLQRCCLMWTGGEMLEVSWKSSKEGTHTFNASSSLKHFTTLFWHVGGGDKLGHDTTYSALKFACIPRKKYNRWFHTSLHRKYELFNHLCL